MFQPFKNAWLFLGNLKKDCLGTGIVKFFPGDFFLLFGGTGFFVVIPKRPPDYNRIASIAEFLGFEFSLFMGSKCKAALELERNEDKRSSRHVTDFKEKWERPCRLIAFLDGSYVW